MKRNSGSSAGEIDQLGCLVSSAKLNHHVGAAGNEPGIGARTGECEQASASEVGRR